MAGMSFPVALVLSVLIICVMKVLVEMMKNSRW